MKLRPLDDKIVIKKIEKEETTASGIVLPTGNKLDTDEEMKGLVKVGDKVIFSKYAGNDIELDDEKYTIIKFQDILAVIE